MTTIDNILFWKKYRPNTIDDIILLPRVKEVVKNGLKTLSLISLGIPLPVSFISLTTPSTTRFTLAARPSPSTPP